MDLLNVLKRRQMKLLAKSMNKNMPHPLLPQSLLMSSCLSQRRRRGKRRIMVQVSDILSMEAKLCVMEYKEGSRSHSVQENAIFKDSCIRVFTADRAVLYETIEKNWRKWGWIVLLVGSMLAITLLMRISRIIWLNGAESSQLCS